jgi:NADH-ubiquinone oxidoreductase chain 2
MVYIFNIWKIFHINKIFTIFTQSKSLKFVLIFNLLSLGGLPPFLGFIPKWLIINQLTINYQYLLTFILIAFTLITLYFYLRICYSGFILNNFELNWIFRNQINKNQINLYLFSSSISILGLPLIRLIYFIL